MTTVRIISYNLQGCRNSGAIFQLIDHYQADYVALQNIQDLPRGQTLDALAAFCGMDIASQGETRDLALLCRRPVKMTQTYDLGHGAGCMRAELIVGDKRCLLYNVCLHGGLYKRWIQIRRLHGPDVLNHHQLSFPTIVLGDFLDVIWMVGSLRFHKQMIPLSPPFYQGTYPAFFPIFARDKAYGKNGVMVESSFVDRSEKARKGSRHLPLIMDVMIVDNRIALKSEKLSKAAPARVFSS